MEEHSFATRGAQPVRLLSLECGPSRFPVVALGAESCLIEVGDGPMPRGFADIFDGDRHLANCLIVLAEPEWPYLRCFFKRRTLPRSGPPPDFAV